MADLHKNDGMGDKSFSDMITQVDKVANCIHQSELQLAQAKSEGIINKLIMGMPQASSWDSVKKDCVKYLVQ